MAAAEGEGTEDAVDHRLLALARAVVWAGQHWPVVAASAVVLYAVHLLRIARGDADTARALVRYANPFEMVLGALVGYLHVLTLFGLSYGIILVARTRTETPNPLALLLLVGSTALAVTLTPVVAVVLVVPAAAVVAGWRRLWRERPATEDPHGPTSRLRLLLGTVGVGLGLGLLLWYVPSAPPHAAMVFETTDGTRLVAYELDADDETITVLTDRDRQVRLLERDDIAARHVCARRQTLAGRSLMQVLVRESTNRPATPCSGRRR